MLYIIENLFDDRMALGYVTGTEPLMTGSGRLLLLD